MTDPRRHFGANILNFALFQVAWFACVLGAANGLPLLGPVVVAAWVVPELVFGRQHRSVAPVLAASGVIGYAADSTLVLGDVIAFPDEGAVLTPSRVWMVALWVNLGGTLHASLAWLLGRYGVAALVGLAGGPLAYLAGSRLGAIEVLEPLASSIAWIGGIWALSFPLLVLVATKSLAGAGGSRCPR